jgi:hypothetical protein
LDPKWPSLAQLREQAGPHREVRPAQSGLPRCSLAVLQKGPCALHKLTQGKQHVLLFIRVITFALNTLKMLLFHHEALLLLRVGDDGEA